MPWYEGSFFFNHIQYFFFCLMFCPANFLHSSPSPYLKKNQVCLYPLSSWSKFLNHTAPHSISVFIIRIFNVLITFPLRSSLLFENASFPVDILLISLWNLTSVVIILPR